MATDLVLSLLRAMLVGGLATAAAWLSGGLPRRRLAMAVALTPLFAPSLLTAYGWQSISLRLLHQPLAQEGLYVLLMTARLLPVALIIGDLAPAIANASGMHLLRSGDLRRRAVRLAMLRGRAVSCLGVGILAFMEFDLAAIFSLRSWSVRIFDAQAGGLPVAQSLRLAAGPAVVLAGLLGAGLWLLTKPGSHLARGRQPTRRRRQQLGAACQWLALLLAFAFPVAVLCRDLPDGLAAALAMPMTRELLPALLYSAAAAVLVLALAQLTAPAAASRRRWLGALLPAVPGLFGPLLLALGILALLQGPLAALLRWPWPWLLGLVFWLYPYALVLRLAGGGLQPDPGVHLAGLGGRNSLLRLRLLWHLQLRRQALPAVLLFLLAYGELTIGAILAPVETTPIMVRLYNLMHYGQSAVLSGHLALTIAVPLVPAALVLAAGGQLGTSGSSGKTGR